MTRQQGQEPDPNWAWTLYEPDARRPWNLARAAHLYRRAGFGANWRQLQQAISDGPQTTVSRLVRPETDVEAFDRTYDEYEETLGSVNELRPWWLRRMIETPHPLQEKMTLFWHNHFATNGSVLKQARLMREHLQLLRRHALGRFDLLLREIACDPALLIWLGAEANRKAMPNAGFVRPLMENFTLGPGQFSEEDLRGAAKAFTGSFVLRDRFRYIAREHDEGTKRLLGQEGNFTGQEALRILLEQPATAQNLVRKLFRWLISETHEPSRDLIEPLAQSLINGYDLSNVVETMLRSNLFFSSHAYRRKIKSPVEFSVGIVVALEGMVSTTQLAEDVAGLGQDLCHPPTVKGWPGGRCWIDDVTLIRCHNLAMALLQRSEPYGDKLNPCAVAQEHGRETLELGAQFILELFLQNDLELDIRDRLLKDARDDGNDKSRSAILDRLTKMVVTLPEFHLA